MGANREAEVFPNPDEVDINRNLDSYIHYGAELNACLGKEASRVALTAMLKVVGRLDNLRRAPGAQGQYTHRIPCLVASGHRDILKGRLMRNAGRLKKIPRPEGFDMYMRADHGSYFPFPTSKLP